jgi:hypothetical protein
MARMMNPIYLVLACPSVPLRSEPQRLTCAPMRDRERLLSATSVESPASLDFARSFFSKMRYKTPMATMRKPPYMLGSNISKQRSRTGSIYSHEADILNFHRREECKGAHGYARHNPSSSKLLVVPQKPHAVERRPKCSRTPYDGKYLPVGITQCLDHSLAPPISHAEQETRTKDSMRPNPMIVFRRSTSDPPADVIWPKRTFRPWSIALRRA